jgi:polyisoprenoid-binding protein YceI
MKTTTSLFTLITAGFFLVACGGGQQQKEQSEEGTVNEVATEVSATYGLNLDESGIHWKGEMMGMYSHEGTINFKEGELQVEGGKLSGGHFVVDMQSMVPTDENYKPEEGKSKDKLVGHLSSADFFDVANHPTASFKITSVEGNKATGQLTVRGITGEETVENVTASTMGETMKWTGTLTFNRKNYDVAFEHPVQEMVLSNDIVLNITLISGAAK